MLTIKNINNIKIKDFQWQGNEWVLGYRLWTTNGKHTYLNTNEIPSWNALVGIVFKNIMVCN
jgi:hypothetical protein